ncbi:MAG TPA: hypothetical protein VHE83_18325 [Mycobacteriales bacterium]|nr:hypothetical protein [Mycobacteriales bacterium]
MLRVEPSALRAAADAGARDSWSVRLAGDDLARALAAAQPHLGAAAGACGDGIGPIVEAARSVADSLARLADSLRTLADAYPHVDGQHRSPAR